MNSDNAKYDMRLNPMYQIDCQNATSGKRVSVTKRRVRFRFGFSSAEAISKGMTGMNCRGEEHEVSLVWSLTSGKRLVIADGDEVHYSKGKRTEIKFETSWTMSGGHVIKIIAHAAPPLKPGFRQFDLLVDGCSFFDMPCIFELGVVDAVKKASKNVAAPALSGHVIPQNGYGFASLPEEDHHAWAHKVAEIERRHSMTSAPSVQEQPNVAEPADRANSMPLDILSDPLLLPQDHLAAPVALLDQAADNNNADVFEPRAPEPFQAATNEIMSAYGPPITPTNLALTYDLHSQQQQQPPTNYHQPVTTHFQATSTVAPPQALVSPGSSYGGGMTTPSLVSDNSPPPQQYAAPPMYVGGQSFQTVTGGADVATAKSWEETPVPVTPTMMAPLFLDENRGNEPELSAMESAMNSLVNLNDINETNETPEQIKAKGKKQTNQPFQSQPKPPMAPDWHLGSQPSLADIKQHAAPKAAPEKEIMKTHAFDPAAAQAGMLVVYNGRAPPASDNAANSPVYGIPGATGFGAGAVQMSHGFGVPSQHYPQHQQVYAGY